MLWVLREANRYRRTKQHKEKSKEGCMTEKCTPQKCPVQIKHVNAAMQRPCFLYCFLQHINLLKY